MTAPNHQTPDGAFEIGDKFGQGIGKDAVKPLIDGKARDMLWEAAKGIFRHREKVGATAAEHYDGQNAMRMRMDLLRDASGYGSAFMGKNWDVPAAKWVVMPFDTGLGPAKGVAVQDGRLVLKKGGLWRVDFHGAASGYTTSTTMTYYPPVGGMPGRWVTTTEHTGIKPVYVIEVVGPDGKIFSSRRYESLANLSLVANGWFNPANNFPLSAAFSHTFVLPEMPPETDPKASESWYRVHVAMKYDLIPAGSIVSGQCKLVGGTQRTALIASRWSRDAVNLTDKAEVPDGGILG
ncbi:hypothetical protein [Nocardia sp. IFM 10818]